MSRLSGDRKYKPDLSISGGSSDDSYLSADEDSAEAPRFVRPIEDTAAPGGSEATLRCIIAGSPTPTGKSECTPSLIFTCLDLKRDALKSPEHNPVAASPHKWRCLLEMICRKAKAMSSSL